MPNRSLKESITTSETVDRLSLLAESFFYRLIVNCDDYGRMDARPAVLLARCFPLKIGILHETDIQQALTELVNGDFIFLYQNGHEFLQIKNWHSHQQIRAQRSKYPAPPDEDGNQLLAMDSGCSRNPIQSESESQSESQSNPNPAARFDLFWHKYPKKSAKQAAQKVWRKLNPDSETFAEITDGLQRAIASAQWAKDQGQYIPLAATWLNGRRWEDEPAPAQLYHSYAMNRLVELAKAGDNDEP